MREAIRRALWILPTIFLVSILAFFGAARNAPPPLGEEGLPLLFNASPADVGALSWSAALVSSEGGPGAAGANELLVRLGGAALPHLLPRFDTLGPSERRRVALALLPVARRMQLREAFEIRDGEQAELFWLGFWQDHFVDFRPTVTRRVTSRFATRSTPLRKEELLRLDTYALDEILTQMTETRDPAVIRRLCAAGAHIAEKPWTVAPEASAEQMKGVVESWQAWWARHKNKYTETAGAPRLLAPLLQTRYALWFGETLRTRFGTLSTGESALVALGRTAGSTLWLFAMGLLGGSMLGLLLSAVFRARAHPFWSRAASGVALGWLGLPLVTLIDLVRSPDQSARSWVASALVLMSGTAIALLYARARTRADGDVAPASHRLGRFLLHTRGVGQRTLRGVAVNASTMLGVVFLVEFGFALPGWGQETVRAVLARDVTWLMLIVISTATLLGAVHVLVAIGERLWRSDAATREHGTN